MDSWRSAYDVVDANNCHTHINETSSSRKGVISDVYPVYYHGQRRKNYAMMIMLNSYFRTESFEAVATIVIWQRTWKGILLTWLGGGTCLL